MKRQLEQVRNFMEAFGQPSRQQPVRSIPVKERALRVQLIAEELEEFASELGVPITILIGNPMTNDEFRPDKILDALTDLLYVVYGSAISTGLQDYMIPGFEEVHRSNMSKLGPDGLVLRNDRGKILKGPHYTKPDLLGVLSNAVETPLDT